MQFRLMAARLWSLVDSVMNVSGGLQDAQSQKERFVLLYCFLILAPADRFQGRIIIFCRTVIYQSSRNISELSHFVYVHFILGCVAADETK